MISPRSCISLASVLVSGSDSPCCPQIAANCVVPDLRLGFPAGQDFLPGGHPPGTPELSHLRQPGRLLADRLAEPVDAQPGAAVGLEGAGQHAREGPLQVRVIQFGPSLIAMSRHQQRAGVLADPQPDAPQPALDLVLLLALTGVPRHHVQGAAGEEELMGDPVYLLAAEIPPSHGHVPASRGIEGW